MTEEQKIEKLKDIYFTYERMSSQERDMCLEYLSKCKEFTNSDIVSQAISYTLVSVNLVKDVNTYNYSGSYSIKLDQVYENRYFVGSMKLLDNKFLIQNEITRLNVSNEPKVFNTVDKFIKIHDNTYERESRTSFSNIIYRDEIELNDYSKIQELNKGKSL